MDWLIFNTGSIMAAAPSSPVAYIDPSTGGMLFQILAVILAAFSGILFFFSRQIKAGIARVRRMIRKDSNGTEDNQSKF